MQLQIVGNSTEQINKLQERKSEKKWASEWVNELGVTLQFMEFILILFQTNYKNIL